MRLIPTGSNVVIAKVIGDKKSKLILSETAQESVFKRWKVAAIGPECKVVKLDQYIVFNSPTAGEIEEGGAKYVILPEKDIVAVYSE